jgi:serine/threonine protein kinase
VALKVFPKRFDKRTMSAFSKEQAKLATVSRVTSILMVDGVEELTSGEPALRMELCTQSLAGLVERVGPLAAADVVVLGRAVAVALAAAHGAGVVHGGISPSNVLFRNSGEPVVGDFGVTLRQAFTRDPLHAIEYLPPETLRTGTLNESTDLYGLGAVLHFALSGRSPHPGRLGEQPGERVLRILGEPVPALNRPDVPIGLSTLVARLLSTTPDRRPHDATQVAAQLTTMLPNPPRTTTPEDWDDFDTPAPPVNHSAPPPQPKYIQEDPLDFDDFAFAPPPPHLQGRQAGAGPQFQRPVAPAQFQQGGKPSLAREAAPGQRPAGPTPISAQPTPAMPQRPVPPAAPQPVPPTGHSIQPQRAQAASQPPAKPAGLEPAGRQPIAPNLRQPAPSAGHPVAPQPQGAPVAVEPPATPKSVASAWEPAGRQPSAPGQRQSASLVGRPVAPQEAPVAVQLPVTSAQSVGSEPGERPIVPEPQQLVPPVGRPVAQSQVPVAVQPPATSVGPVASAREPAGRQPTEPELQQSVLPTGSPVASQPQSAPIAVQRPATSAEAVVSGSAGQQPSTPELRQPVPPVEHPVALPPQVPPVAVQQPVAAAESVASEPVESQQSGPLVGGSVVSQPQVPAGGAAPVQQPFESAVTPEQQSLPIAPAPALQWDGQPDSDLLWGEDGFDSRPSELEPAWRNEPPAVTEEFSLPTVAFAAPPRPADSDQEFGEFGDFGDSEPRRGSLLAGPLAPPGQSPKRTFRYDLLAGAALLLALLALVPLLLLRSDPEEMNSTPKVPAAGSPTGADVLVELSEPTDLTDQVQLSWHATRDFDFAVVIAAEGEKAKVLLAERNHSMTVPVDPAKKYCFQVQATDGGSQVYESKPVPLRGASCRERK